MLAQPPPPRPQAMAEPPGTKASRTCGLLSIIFAVTCAGIPVAIVLGIIALVQQAKARRLAGEFPQEFRRPDASGLVMGIVGLVLPILMLPFVGIVSAIAIPALLAQRDRAVNKAISGNLGKQTDALMAAYDQAKEVGLDQPAIHASLEQALRAAQERNPVNPQAPAFRYTVPVVSASSGEEAKQQAEAEATTPGEIVFIVAFPPDAQHPGYLAGAARLKVSGRASSTTTRVVTLD